jgi:hypothetical protein
MLRDSLRQLSADHKEAVVTLTTACREESKEQRDWMSEEMKKRNTAIEKLAAAFDRHSRVNHPRSTPPSGRRPADHHDGP